jgi:hypothetical protein
MSHRFDPQGSRSPAPGPLKNPAEVTYHLIRNLMMERLGQEDLEWHLMNK